MSDGVRDGAKPEQLFKRLDDLGIDYKIMHHAAVFTVEEAKRLRGEIDGAHVKNLFLRNKKGRMWLLTCLEDQKIDLKQLGRGLGVGPFSFASHERLRGYLGIEPGSVTPLSVINDQGGEVEVLLDEEALAHSPINVHPLVNTMTMALSPEGLLSFLEAEAHPPRVINLAQVMAAA